LCSTRFAESDLAGTLKSEYVFFDGERVARKDFPGNTLAYYFSDHLKTASVITNAAGTITAKSDYYPWGGELQFVNNDSNHYKFTGKERDSETGLDYFGARYYSNGLARWVTPDAPFADQHAGNPQSWNLYMYSASRPTSLIDTDGREVKESKKVATFPVHGKTFNEAMNSAVAYVASQTPLKHSDAWTSTHLSVDPKEMKVEVEPGNGLTPEVVTLTVTDVTVNLNIQENIPEWVEYNAASPTDQAAWDAELNQAKPHEEGHAAIAETGAQALDKKLPGTRGVGTGPTKAKATDVAAQRLKVAFKHKVQTQNAKTASEQKAWDDKAKKEQDSNDQSK
jgi:RHS repeat-associated protein